MRMWSLQQVSSDTVYRVGFTVYRPWSPVQKEIHYIRAHLRSPSLEERNTHFSLGRGSAAMASSSAFPTRPVPPVTTTFIQFPVFSFLQGGSAMMASAALYDQLWYRVEVASMTALSMAILNRAIQRERAVKLRYPGRKWNHHCTGDDRA